MTAEEYIKSKRIESYPGGQLCYTVSEDDAMKAIEMAREEAKAQSTNAVGLTGWICPKCGRVYSPYTSACSYCGGIDFSKITCHY